MAQPARNHATAQAHAGRMPSRQKVLVDIDLSSTLRKSQDNPDLLRLYEDFYGQPGSACSHDLLHTTYAPFRS